MQQLEIRIVFGAYVDGRGNGCLEMVFVESDGAEKTAMSSEDPQEAGRAAKVEPAVVNGASKYHVISRVLHDGAIQATTYLDIQVQSLPCYE